MKHLDARVLNITLLNRYGLSDINFVYMNGPIKLLNVFLTFKLSMPP